MPDNQDADNEDKVRSALEGLFAAPPELPIIDQASDSPAIIAEKCLQNLQASSLLKKEWAFYSLKPLLEEIYNSLGLSKACIVFANTHPQPKVLFLNGEHTSESDMEKEKITNFLDELSDVASNECIEEKADLTLSWLMDAPFNFDAPNENLASAASCKSSELNCIA